MIDEGNVSRGKEKSRRAANLRLAVTLAVVGLAMYVGIMLKTSSLDAVIAVLPHLNAALNALATCFLVCGFVFIRQGDKVRHRACMTTAAATSCLFLISYVTLRFNAPIFAFGGEGSIRLAYFSLLASHVVLAMAIVPLVLLTLFRAFKRNFMAHRRIARWTWPVWMYVSVSGIVVYLMLYQIYPPAAVAAIVAS